MVCLWSLYHSHSPFLCYCDAELAVSVLCFLWRCSPLRAHNGLCKLVVMVALIKLSMAQMGGVDKDIYRRSQISSSTDGDGRSWAPASQSRRFNWVSTCEMLSEARRGRSEVWTT